MEITEVPHLVVQRRFNTTFAKSLVQYTDIHAPPLCGLGPHAAMAKRAADRVHATVEHAKVRGGGGGGAARAPLSPSAALHASPLDSQPLTPRLHARAAASPWRCG